MENGAAVTIANIVLWNYFAIVVNVIAFVIMYMKANRNASLKAFFVVHFSMIIWLIGKVFKTVSPTAELRWFFIVFYYFGICLLGASFLDFSYIYCKGKPMKKILRIAIYSIALAGFILVATNPYHYMFYKIYNFRHDDFGQLFYVHLTINYLFILIGMILCGSKFSKQLKDRSRFERNIISLAILIPLAFNFIYITRWLENQFVKWGIGNLIFDITPIVYTWSILVFVYATFKYEFFDLTPIMKHEITGRLDNPLLILDSSLDILYYNDQFENNFDELKVHEKLIMKLDLISENNANSTIEYENRFYKYHTFILKSITAKRYIISFADVSSYQYAKNELYKENKQLEISNKKLENQIETLIQMSHIGARSYISRELHDILGHSLVITIKLLEVSKMYYKQNKQRTVDSLEKAKTAINCGFNEMKSINNRNKNEVYNSANLEGELRRMLKVVDVSGINVTFFLRGQNNNIEEKVYDIVKKVATELVTNTLKHANASKLLLSITITNDEIMLQTMDNGVGVKNLVKGNGLIGIDGRLSLVDGKSKYSSSHLEGFSSNIAIPL